MAYVKCAHCSGTGKCDCAQCVKKSGVKVGWAPTYPTVTCSACGGAGVKSV